MHVDDKYSTLSIRAVTDAWIDKSVHPNPEYQRGSTWSQRQRQLLIDSVLRGYPLPRFYFQRRETVDVLGNTSISLDVIDGQQRIIALSEFRQDMWPLFEVNDPKIPLPATIRLQHAPWSGKTFSALSERMQQDFLSLELSVVLIDEVSGDEVRDLFIRLQAGTPLTAQQVRDAWPGAIGPYIESLAGKTARQGRFQSVFLAVDRRGGGGRSDDEFVDPALDARQTCAQLLLLLFAKEQGRSVPSLRSSALNDLYHQHTDFDVHGRVANLFEQLLSDMQAIIGRRPPGAGRKSIRKNRLFSLLLFLRVLRFSPVNIPRALDPIADLFWSTEAEETEPSGRVGSAGTLEKHLGWFVEERMASLRLPELDRDRLFSGQQKTEIWSRDKGICGLCGKAIPEGGAEYDHVTPWILGGKTEVANGRPVHPSCHPRGVAAVDGKEAPDDEASEQ